MINLQFNIHSGLSTAVYWWNKTICRWCICTQSKTIFRGSCACLSPLNVKTLMNTCEMYIWNVFLPFPFWHIHTWNIHPIFVFLDDGSPYCACEFLLSSTWVIYSVIITTVTAHHRQTKPLFPGLFPNFPDHCEMHRLFQVGDHPVSCKVPTECHSESILKIGLIWCSYVQHIEGLLYFGPLCIIL